MTEKKENPKKDEGAVAEGSAVGASKGVGEEKSTVAPKESKESIPAVESAPKPKKGHSSGIVFAVLLIFVGLLFLLNNFGILPWSIWTTLWRFWPVFLILIGLQIILGRSRIGSWLLGITSLFLVGAIAVIVVASSNEGFNTWILDRTGISLENLNFLGAPEETTESYSVEVSDYEGVQSREITIDVGAGEFSVSDEREGALLVVDSKYYFPEQAPKISEERSGGALELGFRTEGGFRLFGIAPNSPTYDFTIGQSSIKTNLEITLGAGEGNIVCDSLQLDGVMVDLGSGKLTFESSEEAVIENSFELDVGAGRADITFAEKVPASGADIDVDAGSVYLYVPENVGLKIEYDIGAGVLEVEGNNIHGDGTFTSENYNSSEIKLDLKVDIGAGKVEIGYS